MKKLVTTVGLKVAEEMKFILPHEHVFVDLRTSDQPGHGQADTADVIRLMLPELKAAENVGITAIVECSPIGVGRRADILKAVSDAAGYPLIIPTGVYREPWIPPWVHEADETALEKWMTGELLDGIENTGVKAGWIKLSANDNGLTACEEKVLRAAAQSAAKAGAVIGSHTVKGKVAERQLDIIEKTGYSPDRFIWIHAHCEQDFSLHLEMAARGAWIEYDAIGGNLDDYFIELILRMLDAGYGRQLLLSQDRGGYNPALQGGGTPSPYTYIIQSFLPRLQKAGVNETTISMLMHDNPFNAFAR